LSTPANPVTSQLPPIVYAAFFGPIDPACTQRIANGLTNASVQNVKEAHVLFQSLGGTVGEAIALYNLFKALTFDLTIYNVGQICSAALIAYLGAKHRKTSKYATFMTHRTTGPAIAMEASRLKTVTESVLLDDQRTETILRQHITMPEDKWDARDNDLWFSAEDAVKFGIADEIAEFAPPLGSKLFHI
jgi:ATP-dependent Clp protease, protease subunit